MNKSFAEKIETSFLSFFEIAHRVIEIKNEQDYLFALEFVEDLMSRSVDRSGEPLLKLIDIVAASIEKYEKRIESVNAYMKKAESLDPGVSTLRLLIYQHHLSYSDLKEEIGSKSLVSQILSGSKKLTRNHIAKLTKRFEVSPELFF